jgi:phage-related protein
MNAGSVVFDAILSILPDFMADAIRGTASAIGNAASGVTDAVGNFAQGAADTFSGMFGGGGETNNNTTVNNQQNQVDATVEVNNSEETAGETGHAFGQGFNNEVNRGMFGDRRP